MRTEAESCRALWIAVLTIAVRDAEARLTGDAHRHTEGKVNRAQACAWFERGGRDFETVCTLAGLEPSAVREAWIAGRLNRRALASRGDPYAKAA